MKYNYGINYNNITGVLITFTGIDHLSLSVVGDVSQYYI
jgi:hypothetical protein